MKEYVPFLDERLEIKWTEDLGYGVYARADIEANKFIEISPVIVCENEISNFANLANYIIAWNEKVAVPLGWTMIYNHSDNNCCDFSCNYYENLLAIISNRNIMQGQQVTVNYGPLWFSSRGISKIDI